MVDRIVAVVNDDIILQSDLEQALDILRASLSKQGYPSTEQTRILKDQRKKILKQLIYDKLTDQQVERLQLKVSDEDVDATIGRIRSANKLSEQELIRALELDGMTYDQYRTDIKEKMLRARLVNRQVKSKIVITDKDVQEYYNAHPELYGGSIKYNLRHILLKVTEDDDQNRKKQILEQMNSIIEKLKTGASFEDLAKEYSQAPTAKDGGHLGIFGTQLLTDEIGKALEGLQPKQYSHVVETDQGYQIFFVEDIVSPEGKTLADASAEIREKLYAEIVDRKFKAWIEDLRKRSHIQVLDD